MGAEEAASVLKVGRGREKEGSAGQVREKRVE